jgi:hypothetical protein
MGIARRPVGCLVNFGHKRTLEWKWFILLDGRPPWGEYLVQETC